MEFIFHEKQEGRMCAQHCLNSLLQGAYFGPVELSDLAHIVDYQERIRMAESGIESQSYRDFLQAPSENVDDSGYFSLEVLNAALLPWNLELVPYYSSQERAQIARDDPSLMCAYICNYHQHWFTIRKIGQQWFNLDSTFKRPKLLSDTYMHLYLAQIISEGYSIFIVFGDLPPCEADEILRSCRVTNNDLIPAQNEEDEDEKNLKLALQMSLKESPSRNNEEAREINMEEVRRKRMERFGSQPS